jgi:gliding motility-associated-like protein
MQPCLNLLKFLLIIAIAFISNNINAQATHLLPPNQPEQDACNALVVCGNSFYTPYSYTGTGRILDLASTPCAANYQGEFNSVWLRLNINTAGKLIFKIIPVDAANDYDFAVLNATINHCNTLSVDDVVRCNFNANDGDNNQGISGLSDNSTTSYVEAGTYEPFCKSINAMAGESYLIMIENFAANESTGNGALSGFTIDFSGSTATFNNNTVPDLSSANVPCNNARSITVNLNTEVLCNSIAPDGSDFTINAPVAITGAAGINCVNDSGYTRSVVINFFAPLPAGNYIIQSKKGSDGNTLLNLCNNALALPSKQFPFIILSSGIEVTENKVICGEQLPFIWNGITVTKSGDHAADYTTVSSAGCDSTTILNLTVSKAPEQSTLSGTICSYQSYILPWDSTVTSAGMYTHHFKNKAGCDSLFEQVILKDSACKQFVYIPTAFTPNSDNRNDIFKPLVSGTLLQYSFTIYNRWGKMIFFSRDSLKGWNGTVDGFQQSEGTYIWICNYQLSGEPFHTEKGTVVLIR